jgi:hypothetical protein
MNTIGSQLGVTTLDGWYSIPVEDIKNRGGSPVLLAYGSLLKGKAFIHGSNC